MSEDDKEKLIEVLANLRTIQAPTPWDVNIDNSIKIIVEMIKQ